MSYLTVEQAAARLGVKVETIYAYVSRGVLTSRRRPGSRISILDPDEVESVARRGRPRRSTRPSALDLVIESRLTSIEGGRLLYRGRDVADLARSMPFEQAAGWLWTGQDRPFGQPWEAAELRVEEAPDIRHRLRLAVVMTSAGDPLRADLTTPAVVATARSLIATMASSLPLRGDGRPARLILDDGGEALRGTLAGRLWGRLTSTRPSPKLVATLNAALVLLADHELAASTLAARVAASVRADPYAVVLAGMGPLAGTLHGGASRLAYELLESAAAAGAAGALARALELHGHYPGFGHPLYREGDPRAMLLLGMIRDAVPESPTLAVSDRLTTVAFQRGDVRPNVDFALAVLARVSRMPPDSGEAIFTVARTAGWLAHAIEEYGETPLRFRARALPRR